MGAELELVSSNNYNIQRRSVTKYPTLVAMTSIPSNKHNNNFVQLSVLIIAWLTQEV